MKQQGKFIIIDSFKDLLNQKSIDKITVKDICAQGGVNRQTFYYYFKDIMDILSFTIFKELSVEIAQNRTFETWEEGFIATMNYMKKNSKMILHIYNSSYWDEAKTYFVDFSNNLLYNVVKECVNSMGVKLQDKNKVFIVNFYRHIFNGLMLDWVSEGMKEEPEIILRKLLLMITGSIPRSVTAFAEYEIKE
ncbi:TetR/AcrR family transcriptional regulator [Clostridium hydrogeniformans]|uniref:TetR/AcrR family transcriptional regulator n=1 Tax=Clostridium hydrogeniformans TaxID=349933 RepID=UPI0004833E3E|nr:TetR/AcrR family transcriptional regulator [Clostridium hydrogeniformans]